MKRFILVAVAFIALIVPVCQAGDITPLYDGTGVTRTVVGSFTFNNMGTSTLANGEKIANDVDGEITSIYDDDAVVIGTETEQSVNTGIAAGDEFRKNYEAYNDATQEVNYARVVVDLTDETDGTEDGTYEIWVMAAGTLTKIASVDASGVAIVGAVDANNVTVDAGAGVDNQAAGTLLLGAATATKVEIGATGVETEVQGSLDCVEGVTFQSAIFSAASLPTATNGLPAGRVWLNSNVLTITP